MERDVDALLKRTAAWTAALTGLWAVAMGLWQGFEMALGIVAGATLGFVNLWLAARALRGILQNPEAHRPVGGRKWALPVGLLLKWPLMLLALFAILWYMPARPEGVALGVAISLAGASIAAMKRSTSGSSPS